MTASAGMQLKHSRLPSRLRESKEEDSQRTIPGASGYSQHPGKAGESRCGLVNEVFPQDMICCLA